MMSGPRDELVLQVSLAPGDVPHARHILPHQIRQWERRVDRIVLTVDTMPGGGRYAANWARLAPQLNQLLESIAETRADVVVVPVDYRPETAARLSERFLGGRPVPAKDSHGAPFHAYLFGLDAAAARYVLHCDADMLFGGGGDSCWRDDLLGVFEDEDVLLSGPYPCPPLADGKLAPGPESRSAGAQRFGSIPVSSSTYGGTLTFRHATTRCFAIDLDRFERRVGALMTLDAPPTRFSSRTPGVEPLEVSLSAALREHGLLRREFLGAEPGRWSLHPPFHSAPFLRQLPEIIAAVESSVVPDLQRGDYDLNDSMVDWTSARREARTRERRRRLGRRFEELKELVDLRGWSGR